MGRLPLGLATAIAVVPACEGKVRSGPSGASSPAPAASAPGGSPSVAAGRPAVRCIRTGSKAGAVAGDVYADVTAHALRLTAALQGTSALPIWNDLHPAVRDEASRERFLASTEDVARRVRKGKDPKVESVLHLDVAPSVEDVLKIRCDTPQGPWHVATRVDGEDLAVVYVDLADPVLAPRLVVRLARRNDGWHLLGIESASHRFRGAGPAVHLDRSEQAARSGRHIQALLEAGIAQVLAFRGRGVETPQTHAVAALLRDGSLRTKALDAVAAAVGLPRDAVLDLGLSNSGHDLAPRLRYRTELSLADEAAVRSEAAAHVRKLVAAHPWLADRFGTVVVEAVARPRTERTGQGDAARIAVRIESPVPTVPG